MAGRRPERRGDGLRAAGFGRRGGEGRRPCARQPSGIKPSRPVTCLRANRSGGRGPDLPSGPRGHLNRLHFSAVGECIRDPPAQMSAKALVT